MREYFYWKVIRQDWITEIKFTALHPTGALWGIVIMLDGVVAPWELEDWVRYEAREALRRGGCDV